MNDDRAEINHLSKTLASVGEALDTYLKFEHPDACQNQRAWH